MANFEAVPTKRKLDQFEDEPHFSSKKKIKAEENTHTEDVILFSDLPPEIVHLFLSFITNDTHRRHIRLVCRLWFDYIDYNEFSIGLLFASEVEQFSRCFGRYQKPIGLKFRRVDRICNIKETRNVGNKTVMRLNHLVQSISSLTQLTALDLCMKDFEVPPKLINLQSLTVISPLHRDTILRLTNLRRLKTDSKLTETPTMLESLDLWDSTNRYSNAAIDDTYSRLTELVISKSSGCEIPDALTNLRKLSVFGDIYTYSKQINLMKFSNLEEFITTGDTLLTRYSSTLTKLHVFSSRSVEITEDLTQLKDLQCSSANFNNLALNSMEGCIVHYDNETLLELLNPQKVTKLKTTLTPENCHIWSKFTNLIDLNISLLNQATATLPYLVPLPSLKQLNLCCNKYPHQWIRELTNLVELRVERVPEIESIDFETMPQLTSLELIGSYKNISIINLTNLLHLRIYNETAPNAINIHGLSTATNLTSLSVKHLHLRSSSNIFQSSELALLTNLRMLELGRTYGAKILNFGDLTTLQRLTFLEVRAIDKSACQSKWYLTRLTRLQQVYLPIDQEVDHHVIQKGLPLCYQFPVIW